MNKVCIFLITSWFLYSCKQSTTSTAGALDNKADTTKFFQISQYIQSEIKAVNSTPYFIYLIDINDTKKDSTPIDNKIFNSISAQFYTPDINNPDLKKFYKENIFFDQTTKNFTISYSTANKELEVQNAEILLKEDGHTVNRVFIRKFFNYADSSAIEQLSWKPGESFQVNRAVQKAGNVETTHQTIVVWNEKAER